MSLCDVSFVARSNMAALPVSISTGSKCDIAATEVPGEGGGRPAGSQNEVIP